MRRLRIKICYTHTRMNAMIGRRHLTKSEYKRTPQEQTSRDLGEMVPILKKALFGHSYSAFWGLTHTWKHASWTLFLLTCMHLCAWTLTRSEIVALQLHHLPSFFRWNSWLRRARQTPWYMQEVSKYDRTWKQLHKIQYNEMPPQAYASKVNNFFPWE